MEKGSVGRRNGVREDLNYFGLAQSDHCMMSFERLGRHNITLMRSACTVATCEDLNEGRINDHHGL